MVEISEALTKRVAELARMRLSAGEVTEFTSQIAKVLDYMELLQTVDVEGVEPMNQPHLDRNGEAVFRPDNAVPSPKTAEGMPKVLESAPETQDGAFQVPQIV